MQGDRRIKAHISIENHTFFCDRGNFVLKNIRIGALITRLYFHGVRVAIAKLNLRLCWFYFLITPLITLIERERNDGGEINNVLFLASIEGKNLITIGLNAVKNIGSEGKMILYKI